MLPLFKLIFGAVMKYLKILILCTCSLFTCLSYSQISENIFSHEYCTLSNNAHFVFVQMKDKTYYQVALLEDGSSKIEHWELIRQSNNHYTLRNIDDKKHFKTVHMLGKFYQVIDIQKDNVYLTRDAINLASGKKNSLWLDCPNASPSGSDGVKKLAAFQEKMTVELDAKEKARSRNGLSADPAVNQYIKEVRKQCEQFPAVEKRCATAGDIDRCIKIYLPNYDSLMCDMTKFIK